METESGSASNRSLVPLSAKSTPVNFRRWLHKSGGPSYHSLAALQLLRCDSASRQRTEWRGRLCRCGSGRKVVWWWWFTVAVCVCFLGISLSSLRPAVWCNVMRKGLVIGLTRALLYFMLLLHIGIDCVLIFFPFVFTFVCVCVCSCCIFLCCVLCICLKMSLQRLVHDLSPRHPVSGTVTR